MLADFGRAGYLSRARQQPEKVQQQIRADGLVPTFRSVQARLSEPEAPSYSNLGVVTVVGEGVEGSEVGDHVVSNAKHAEVVYAAVQSVCPGHR